MTITLPQILSALISGGALCALASIFIGYPMLVALRARIAPRPYPSGPEVWRGRPDEELPRVAILMSAHNEAARLPGKLATLQNLDYPSARVRLYVADDASTDDTHAVLIALAADEPRLSVERSAINVGKPTNLNRLVERVDADGPVDVLVFCDARQPLDPQALRALLAPLADPAVGGATGDLVLPPNPDGSLRGMGAYWRYETLIRTSEAATGSVVGATGALYAVRRALFVPFEAELVLDDMMLPLRVVLSGHRFVFAHGALAFDAFSADLDQEFKRKARTLGGIYQAMALEPRLLRPGAGVFVAFLFHKVGRLAFPWLMALMALGALGALLAGGAARPLGGLLLAAQGALYLGAAAAAGLERLGVNAGPLRSLRTLGALMLASWAGWWRWRRGLMTAAWKPSESQRGRS